MFNKVIEILNNNNIKETDIVDIILVGSRLYNLNSKNSDYDYIVITKKINGLSLNKGNLNITIFSKESYQNSLDNQKMLVIESYFAEKKYKYKNIQFKYNLNKDLLISNTRLNTIETLKKAVRIQEDNYELAKKRFFHAIRINGYKNQILNFGRIHNFSEYFGIYNELKTNYDGLLKYLLVKYKDWLN